MSTHTRSDIEAAKTELVKAGLLDATDADAITALDIASLDLPATLTDQERDHRVADRFGHDAIRAGRVLTHRRSE